MGWKIERSAEKMCFGFCWAHDTWKTSETLNKHKAWLGFPAPNIRRPVQWQLSWPCAWAWATLGVCAPPPLITRSLIYFSMRSPKIASHFKEMQILTFSYPVVSRQTILENTTDPVTLGRVILLWPSLVGWVCSSRKASLLRNWPWSWCWLIKSKW